MPRRNHIACASSVSQNDLIEMRLKEKVKNRMLGIETSGMKVKNLVLEEIVDTILDANEVTLMSIEKELVDLRKALQDLTTVIAEGLKQPASNSELVREMLLQIAAGLSAHSDEIKAEEGNKVRTKRKSTPEFERQRKIKIFTLIKELEDKNGELLHYREAHALLPRLSYYIYGQHRVWSSWDHFRSEYESWLSGLI